MLLKYKLILSVLVLQLFICKMQAQVAEFYFLRNTDKVVIPFEFYYNYIIVKVRIYGVFELKFILDTGAEYSAITQKEVADLLGIQYSRKVNVLGADQKTLLTAFVGTGVDMDIGELLIKKTNILVLTESFTQYYLLSNLNISGIIGADILSRYVLKIDFRKKVIEFHDPAKWHAPKSFKSLDIEINRSKPYLPAFVKVKSDSTMKMKLLLDTGAGLPLLLTRNTLPAELIPDTLITGRLGLGLGGYIEGTLGRISSVEIGAYKILNLMTSFATIDSAPDTINFYQKNGILGNDVMRLFDWYIDYAHQVCYVKPNKAFSKAPVYDKSGLILMAFGTDLDKYIVIDITPGSPACQADIRKGDVLRSVNHIPKMFLGYNRIIKILSRKEGDKVILGLKRAGKSLKKSLVLKNMI